MTDHARVLARVLAGRKRVKVATWKWDHPQSITTLQRVPLPIQRVQLPRQRVERAVPSFADYINRTPLTDERGTDR
jgi:hypothetical protein